MNSYGGLRTGHDPPSWVAQPAAGEIVKDCRGGFELASSMDWKSYDPFDLLLVKHGEFMRRYSPLTGRLVVQLGRRTGSRVRHLARIAQHEEAKAIGDFLLASVLLSSRYKVSWSHAYIKPLADRLERLTVKTRNGVGWGLGFPYASRFVSVPARTPNAYTTICCVAALTRAAEYLHDDAPLDLALAGAQAISVDLGIVRDGGRCWFRYWPGDDSCILNVQALVAGCFQRLGAVTGDGGLSSQAELAVATVLASQRSDGSFPYSTDRRARFVDAFHTGFVLEGLTRFRMNSPYEGTSHVRECVNRGMEFLRAHLMDASHFPRRSPGGPVARDGQNVGQLIQTLVACGDDHDRLLAADLWRRWASGRSRDRTTGGDDRRRVTSLRWEVGPTVLAGAHLASVLAEDR